MFYTFFSFDQIQTSVTRRMVGIVLTLSGLLEEKGVVLGRLVFVEASPIACLQGLRGVQARLVCFGLCVSIGSGLHSPVRETGGRCGYASVASFGALVGKDSRCYPCWWHAGSGVGGGRDTELVFLLNVGEYEV